MADRLLVQTFYSGLDQSLKISIDTAASGALVGKSIEAMRALVEEMTSNNYHWFDERATPKRATGVYGFDAVNLLASNVDALAQCFDKRRTPSSGNPLGVLLVQCLRLGLCVRIVAYKAMLLLSANPLSRELSMPMLCKTLTYAHKTTPTQTHRTLVREITYISHTTTTTPFHQMPLNFNPLVFNTGLPTTHIP